MSQIALPFLTLTTHSVFAERWLIANSTGQKNAAEKSLAHWDYATDILISRMLRIDFSKAADELRLPQSKLMLGVRVRAGTGQGLLPRILSNPLTKELSEGNDLAEFELALPGRRLAKRLHLETTVFLASQSNGDPLSPRLIGSRLWSDIVDIQLEGEDPLFPLEAISFSKHFAGRPEEGALWYLHWSPFALQMEFTGGVRLYLNSDRPEFMQRMLDRDPITIQTVISEVINQTITSVLRQEGLDELLPGFEAGSVGNQIYKWMRLAFPGQLPSEVREIATYQPSVYCAAIQSISDVGGVSA